MDPKCTITGLPEIEHIPSLDLVNFAVKVVRHKKYDFSCGKLEIAFSDGEVGLAG
jgi:hypothetical protein